MVHQLGVTMRRHRSFIIKARLALAKIIDPFPDIGEAWCVNCSLNNGKTLLMSSDSVIKHTDKHVEVNPNEELRLRWQDAPGDTSSVQE
jgi:hypothetical protein